MDVMIADITCGYAGAYAHGLTSSLVPATGYNGSAMRPRGPAAQGPSRPAPARQGFMPYKWHAQQACGAQQLPPGVFSLGKRSASASLAEPPRKRPHCGVLP